LAQFAGERRMLLVAADGQRFHRAVNVVPDPAGQSKGARFMVNKPAEAHALHASANNGTFRNPTKRSVHSINLTATDAKSAKEKHWNKIFSFPYFATFAFFAVKAFAECS
jgi:hypothetical protein